VKEEAAMNTAKQMLQTLIDELPDDCTFEDVQYRLYVAAKIKRGIERAGSEDNISQAEMEKRYQECLAE
jgi:hypothetical protein